MRALVLLVCLWLGSSAQGPERCQSPDLLTGSLSVSTASEKLMVYANYMYDALGQRIHLRESGVYKNESFCMNALLLYKEKVVYKINYRNRTCSKKPLDSDFHPLSIPDDASLLGQVILGASSGPGQGVLVNSWTGEMQRPKGTAKYITTVTESKCIPVSTLFHTDRTGWVVTSFFNNVIGLVEPQLLIPPEFCTNARLETEDDEEPVTFYSLF